MVVSDDVALSCDIPPMPVSAGAAISPVVSAGGASSAFFSPQAASARTAAHQEQLLHRLLLHGVGGTANLRGKLRSGRRLHAGRSYMAPRVCQARRLELPGRTPWETTTSEVPNQRERPSDMTEPRTFGDLKNSRWAEPPLRGRTVRDEIRANLIARLASGETLFPGIVGYEDTVLPQHRQRAPRAAPLHPARSPRPGQEPHPPRADEAARRRIPVVAGSEVNDDPFRPDLEVRARDARRVRRRDTDRVAAAATSATSRSSPRPTSPSPTSSATSIRSRRRAAGTCSPTS